MNQNLFTLLIVTGTVLSLAACGAKEKASNQGQSRERKAQPINPGDAATQEKAPEKPAGLKPAPVAEPKAATAPREMNKLSDFVDAWTSRYRANEAAINAFEGVPMPELVFPELLLALGPQFDRLNPDGTDGRFDGQLIITGKKGFIEKKGALLSFGSSQALDRDYSSPTAKKGDLQVIEGSADLARGAITLRTRTERGGKKISATQVECRLLADSSMLCLSLNGHSINTKGDPSKFSNFIFLHNGDKRYDFVIAKAELGPDFPWLSMAEKGDLDKAKATALATESGFKVEKSGGVVDGKLVLDK